MEVRELSLIDVLRSREQRVLYQRQLLEEYGQTLISFKLNIPGQVKDSELYRAIFKSGIQALVTALAKTGVQIMFRDDIYKASGPESYLVVAADARVIKSLTIQLEENHPLGRIFDFDLFTPSGEQVSRSELGLGQRKCFVCEKSAFECGRERRHSVEEMLQVIHQKAINYLS